MRTFNVDYLNGLPAGSANGSVEAPYRTITDVLPVLNDGDEIVIGGIGYTQYEPGTLVFRNFRDLSIRFLNRKGLLLCPNTISPTYKSTMYFESCSNIFVDGACFASVVNGGAYQHTHAIRAVNCSNIEISNCRIHGEWLVASGPGSELLSFNNCTAKVVQCDCLYIENSFHNSMSFIAVEGNGTYELLSNKVDRMYSNTGITRGIYIKSDVSSVIIDGFDASGFRNRVIDNTVAVDLESDNTPVVFNLNAITVRDVDIGVRINGIGVGASKRYLKHSTFLRTRIALHAIASRVNFYSNNVHSVMYKTYTDLQNNEVQRKTYGIYAATGSDIHVMNSAFTKMDTAILAESSSSVSIEHTFWRDCTNFHTETLGGRVVEYAYIRNISPEYVNPENGDFNVTDGSPCIDAGKDYGDPYLGSAPDIGAMERLRPMDNSTLPALMSRISRNLIRYPLTEIDVEGMILRGLETQDPTVYASREGSAIRDLTVKPFVALMEPFVSELELTRRMMSFAQLSSLSDEAADMLSANLFVYRNYGRKATGIVRIYFSTPISVYLPAELEFAGSGGELFYSTQDVTVTEEEMAVSLENGIFYVDVIVEANEQGSAFNLPAGYITTCNSTLPAGAISVTNPYEITAGEDKENNFELHRKVENSIAVRDLVTGRGILSVLPVKFPVLTSLTPVGFRDPEMLRDMIRDKHIGGKVDIYASTPAPAADYIVIDSLESHTLQVNNATFDGKSPILKITGIEILDPETLDETDTWLLPSEWKFEVVDYLHRFSVKENNTLTIGSPEDPDEYLGSALKIHFLWVPEFKSIQSWIDDDYNRVVCADLLLRHYQPCFVTASISYYAPNELTSAQFELEYFIRNIEPKYPLQASDLVNVMYGLGATKVHLPFEMRVDVYHNDGRVEVIKSLDEIKMSRTYKYAPDTISLTYLGSEI